MNTVLWMVGEPGIGKTSAARELLPKELQLIAKPKWTLEAGTGQATSARVCAAGHYTGALFDGADTVPYNGAKEALEFWRERLSHHELTLFDGDRFSNKTAVEFFKGLRNPPRLVCVLFDAADEDLAAGRRKQRGSNQNESWVRGRTTKARNFFDGFPTVDRAVLHCGEFGLGGAPTPKRLAELIRTVVGN